jgi:transcriptional regulator with XRE-family HTH domain
MTRTLLTSADGWTIYANSHNVDLMTAQLPASDWWSYVLRTSANGSPSEIARRIGVSQSSVWRWKESSPSVTGVRAFAQGYDRPVLEAFVAAGFLWPDECWGTGHPNPSTELTLLARRITEIAKVVMDPRIPADIEPRLTLDRESAK